MSTLEKKEWQIRRAKMAEEEKIRKDREQRIKLEIKSFRQLARDASRWKESQVIRRLEPKMNGWKISVLTGL